VRILSALLFVSLCSVACGEIDEENGRASTEAHLASMQLSTPLDIALQDVVDIYAVGSRSTDVQRDRTTEKLIGSTVVWTFTVYDIAKEGARYRVSSELMSSTSPDGIGKFGVVAYVFPRSQSDQQIIENLMTGNPVKLKGVVQSVSLRTALVLSPAVLED
jgi:hypothetical protein